MVSYLAKGRINGARLWGDLMTLGGITETEQPYTRRSFSAKFVEGRRWLAARFRDLHL